MNRVARIRAMLGTAVMLTLSACGGGGDDGESDAGSSGSGPAAIEGSLRVASGTFADVDGEARTVSTPATISGSLAPNGQADTYRVTLARGQSVALLATEGQSLRLRLCNGSGFECTSVMTGTGRPVGSLVTDRDGSHELVVEGAASGLYLLFVAGGAPGAGIAMARGDFVPGEIVMRMREGARTNPVQGFRRLGAAGRRPMVLDLGDPGSEQTLSRLDAAGQRPLGRSRVDTLRAVARLRRHPNVLYAEPNYLWRRQRVPNDPRFDDQWHYRAANLPNAWDREIGVGSDVTVAVVDDGIRRHVDLQGRLLFDAGFDFASSPLRSNDGDGIDPDPTDPAADGITHGTNVAALVAAGTNNALGGAGVAWQAARILPIRVGSASRIALADVLNGVRYAAGLATPAGPEVAEPRAEIINISLGGPGGEALAAEFQAARDRGAILVASAGNTGEATPIFPAAYDSVIGVGATVRDGTLAGYSTVGESVSVTAPGGNAAGRILTASGDRQYTGVIGTSFAAPHVSGVLALMKASFPGLTPELVECGLTSGELTDAPGGTRSVRFGYGRLDAARAVTFAQRLASGEASLEPGIVAAPKRIDFGTLRDQVDLDVRVTCGGAALSGRPRAEAGWLRVRASEEGGNRFSVSVDRSALANGLNRTRLSVTTVDGTELQIPVTAVRGRPIAATAGVQFVQLIALDQTGRVEGVLREQRTTAEEGYAYRFNGIESGDYLVVASSDLDDNRTLGELGEISGGWPGGANVEVLSVGPGLARTGIGFPVAPLTSLDLGRRTRQTP